MLISNILILFLVAFSPSSEARPAEDPSHSPRFISNQEVLTRMEAMKKNLIEKVSWVKKENRQMKTMLGKLNEVTEELKQSEAEMKEEFLQQQTTLKELERLVESHVQQCQITTRSPENVTEDNAPSNRHQATESTTLKATTEMPQQDSETPSTTETPLDEETVEPSQVPVTEPDDSSSEEDGMESNTPETEETSSLESPRHPFDLSRLADDSSLATLSAEQKTILKGSWAYVSRIEKRNYEGVLPLLHPGLLKASGATDEKSAINAYKDYSRNKTGFSVDFVQPEKNIFRVPYFFTAAENKKYAGCLYFENMKVTFSKLSRHKQERILRQLVGGDGPMIKEKALYRFTGPDTAELLQTKMLIWLNDERSGYKWRIIFHFDLDDNIGEELEESNLPEEELAKFIDAFFAAWRDAPPPRGPFYTYEVLQKLKNQEFA